MIHSDGWRGCDELADIGFDSTPGYIVVITNSLAVTVSNFSGALQKGVWRSSMACLNIPFEIFVESHKFILDWISKETLNNSTNALKHEAHGMRQPRHINQIDEDVNAVQQNDSFAQSINQCFSK